MAYRIAVTGCSGQLGTALLHRLFADQELNEVRAIDLAPPRVKDPRIRYYQRDVREPGLATIFDGCEAVFHLASVVLQYMPRAEYDSINVGGSKNVFESAAKAGVPYILYTSSISAYGIVPGHPDPIDEATPRRYQPEFPYAANKYEIEAFLDDFERINPGIRITRLRPVIVIGPNDKGPVTSALRKHVVLHYSRNPVPLVWEGDVVQAAVLAFQKRAHGAFVLAAADALPGPRLAAAAGLLCIRIPPSAWRRIGKHLERTARWRKPPVHPSWFDCDVPIRPTSRRARLELGWKPECPTCLDVVKRFAKEVPNEAGPAQRMVLRTLDFITRVLVR